MSNNELLFPPKKSRAIKDRVNSAEKRNDTENIKLVDLIKKNKKKEIWKKSKIT